MSYNLDKSLLRKQMIKKREELSFEEYTYLSNRIFNNFITLAEYKNSKFLMTYMSFRNEVDTKKIIKNAFLNNKRVAVPITQDGEIISSEIFSNSGFMLGKFGVSEPKFINKIDPSHLDLIIVPGNTFDKKGYRIGFGKGYYDKFLPKLNCIKIGLCYDFALVDEIKTSPYDVNVDIIVTDKTILHF